MRRLLSIIVSLVTAISFAQQPVELPLWPDGAPNSSGLTGEEQETRPHFVTNVTHPTLTVYHPEWNGYYHVSRRRVSWTGYGWRGV